VVHPGEGSRWQKLNRFGCWLAVAACGEQELGASAVNGRGVSLQGEGQSWSGAPDVLRELADARSLRRLADWRALPNLGDARRYVEQSSRDRGNSTDPLLPIARAGNIDFNHFFCASADARVSSVQYRPLRFERDVCPEAYVQGVVLGRFEGAGAMVRMWLGMLSLLSAPADDEVLRIYVDDDPVPRLETPLAAAMDGSAGEIFAPPFGAGSSKRLAWYYPVAFRQKLIVALDGLGDNDFYYYQCDAAFDASTSESAPPPPEQPPPEQLPREQLLLERQRAAEELVRFAEPGGAPATTLLSEPIELDAGAARELQVSGPATLLELTVRLPEQDYTALSDVQVLVRWDGATAPAIDVPLHDLFGGGSVPPALSSLALTSELRADQRVLALKLPMPFTRSADIRLENRGLAPIAFELSARGDRSLPAEPFGHLSVREREVRGPTSAPSYAAAVAEGRGRLVGACSHVRAFPDIYAGFQLSALNVLEGDVSATVDGRLALDGTGSEEYADNVFYFQDSPQATAFAQNWDVSPQYQLLGAASYCRWHVLGTELDFSSNLELDVELGGFGNPYIVQDHRTVSYWYIAPPRP
jgi:Protein of unknown function (DUF2961)